MKTQFDYPKRIVALSNLEAMCKRISGTCHTFEVCKVTDHRVSVEYSNPDEYGHAEPIRAEFPAWKSYDGHSVVLDAVRYVGCTGRNEESWQAFEQLFDCRPLFRSSSDSDDWSTEFEILVKRNPGFSVTSTWDKAGCFQTWHCAGKDFKGWQEAQDWAVGAMREYENRVKS